MREGADVSIPEPDAFGTVLFSDREVDDECDTVVFRPAASAPELVEDGDEPTTVDAAGPAPASWLDRMVGRVVGWRWATR